MRSVREALRDRLDEHDISELIIVYREGATAASRAAARDRLESHKCQAPPAQRRYPPDLTYSTGYEGNAGAVG